ncbi:MAG: hypothetical protein FJ096_22410 [Deltaproteobacteria bacterium]|nr:hypothetical protein [Deltaproteobacteria bacterium]
MDDVQKKIERARAAAEQRDPVKILEERYGEVVREHLADAFNIPESEDPGKFEKKGAADTDASTIDPLFAEMPVPPSVSIASVARRKEIESRLDPIQVEHLFATGEVRQEVVIRPSRLRVTFKTLRAREDLYLKRRLSEVTSADSARYVEDRFLSMLLAAQLSAVNGRDLPAFTDKEGVISDANFNKRLDAILDLPVILLEEIWVNYRWFEQRVRDALSPDSLKNG